MRVLYLPAQHRLLGRKVCRVERCVGTVHNDAPEICHRCFTRLTGLGMSVRGHRRCRKPARRTGSRAALRGPAVPVHADGAGRGDV